MALSLLNIHCSWKWFMPLNHLGPRCTGNSCKCIDSNRPCKITKEWGATCFNEYWFAFQRGRQHFTSFEFVGEKSLADSKTPTARSCFMLTCLVGSCIWFAAYFLAYLDRQRMTSMCGIILFKFWRLCSQTLLIGLRYGVTDNIFCSCINLWIF